jgi:hypothetical protein
VRHKKGSTSIYNCGGGGALRSCDLLAAFICADLTRGWGLLLVVVPLLLRAV